MPAIGQLLQLFLRPVPFLNECAAKYGPTFTLRVPGLPPVIQTSDPALIDAVFKGNPDQLRGGRANIGLKPVVGANSLLLLDGAPHRRERKVIGPMVSGRRMYGSGIAMQEIVTHAIDRWPLNAPFAMLHETQTATLDIILRAIFGVEDERILSQFRHAIHRVLKLALLLFPDSNGNLAAERPARWIARLVPKWDVFEALAAMDGLIYAQIERRRAAGANGADGGDGREDVLSLLLQTRYDDGAAMSAVEIRDELVTLLMAGHETSATILAWCIYHLTQHPDVLDRLRAEIHSAADGKPIPLETLNGLPLLDAVIKETMRITPVFSLVARVLTEPQTIGGLACPAPVLVSPNIHGAHHRADAWEDPEQFRPERFLNGRIDPSLYFPFGGGTRKCIGAAFATSEMKIFISEVVRRTRFHTVPGYRASTVRRNNTLAPSKGVPIVVTSRVD